MKNIYMCIQLGLSCLVMLTSAKDTTGVLSEFPDIIGSLIQLPSGINQDRGLGFKNKSKPPTKAKVTFPWAPNPDRTRPTYTDTMRSYESPDEDPLGDDYYDDYDFEFAKSGMKNDNFEKKRNAYVQKRINSNTI